VYGLDMIMQVFCIVALVMSIVILLHDLVKSVFHYLTKDDVHCFFVGSAVAEVLVVGLISLITFHVDHDLIILRHWVRTELAVVID
jgi:hypothetical protein